MKGRLFQVAFVALFMLTFVGAASAQRRIDRWERLARQKDQRD